MCKEDAEVCKIGTVVHIVTSALLRVFSLALQLSFEIRTAFTMVLYIIQKSRQLNP